MDQFFYICILAAALTGAVFFGYPLGFWLGNRNGFELGEIAGEAKAMSRYSAWQMAELARRTDALSKDQSPKARHYFPEVSK